MNRKNTAATEIIFNERVPDDKKKRNQTVEECSVKEDLWA